MSAAGYSTTVSPRRVEVDGFGFRAVIDCFGVAADESDCNLPDDATAAERFAHSCSMQAAWPVMLRQAAAELRAAADAADHSAAHIAKSAAKLAAHPPRGVSA